MPTKYQLKNGMNVLLIESHKSPVVAVQAWVKTGSADESKGLEGISHFIEHLVFKGSEKFNVGEIAQTVESAGGEINAYTTFDQTVFYVTISKEFTDVGLEVISQMMGAPKFDKTEIDNEREVVIEEIKRSRDNPRQQASQLLFSTLYKKHPYGTPIIGFDDVIKRVSATDIKKYYQSRYLPQNMNLVIVGDFSSPQMKKKIESYFGPFKKNKLAVVKRAKEPTHKSPSIAVKAAQFNESFLYISWPLAKATHREILALSIFAIILGQGDSSRLVQHIRNEKQLVNSIGSSLFSPKELGFLAISVALNNERLGEVLAALETEIHKLFQDGFSIDDLNKAVRILESEKFYSMETVDGLAGLYGHYEFFYDDYKYFNKLMGQTEKLSVSEIIKIAKKYIVPKNTSISYLTNGDSTQAQKDLTNWNINLVKQISTQKISKKPKAAGRAAKKVKGIAWSAPKKDRVEPAQRIELEKGSRLLTKIITSSPVVSLRVGFLGGLRLEDEKAAGSNELTQRVWPTASKTLDEVTLNHEIENMASGLGAFGGRNSLGLSMTALAPNFDKTFDMLLDLLLNPALNDEIIMREKQLMKEYLKSRNDKPAQICMRNLTAEIFTGHPYGRDPYANEAAIEKLNRTDLQNHLKKMLLAKNMVVSVVGDVDKKSVRKKIDKVLGQLGGPSKVTSAIAPPAELRSDKKIFVELQKEQSHIALAYRGLRIFDKERFALEVMQAILSGQGGRLFVELRDKASLAYTVAPIRMDGLDTGYFGAYIGCSPEKGDRAVQMMKVEFSKLVNEMVSEEELARAKRYLIGRHDISLQRTGHVADLMLFDDLYGMSFNEFENYRDDIYSVSKEDIRDLAKKLFSQAAVLSVVGKKDVSI